VRAKVWVCNFDLMKAKVRVPRELRLKNEAKNTSMGAGVKGGSG
jgi:hypothetical protein